MFPKDFRLFLASQSPRRSSLLAAAGIPHTIVSSEGQEEVHLEDPLLTAERNAVSKALGACVPPQVALPFFVLGADTVVVLDGEVFGKPRDKEEAASMIARLAGRSHVVVSGVAVVAHEESGELHLAQGCAMTRVWVRALDAAQISGYLATDEWADKAGGYGIQGLGGLLVERIEGEYSTVVGLPLGLMVSLFRQLGFDLIARCWLPATGTNG